MAHSESPPQATDCTVQSNACAELRVDGDQPSQLPNGRPAGFRGAADPCIRKDPLTGTLWMAYSWPKVEVLKGGSGFKPFHAMPGVDTHLASSKDGGATWHFEKVLWPTMADVDKGSRGGAGFTSHEVPNILPHQAGAGVIWYAARQDYFLPDPGAYKSRPPGSFRIRMMQAATPQELSDAPAATLGGEVTESGWGVDVNLSALSPSPDKHIWTEPALYFEGDTLYLTLQRLCYKGASPDWSAIETVVFATKPVGDVRHWAWHAVGQLAGASEAKELGGDGLTQVEIAKGTDGQLLALLTPETYDEGRRDFVLHGCRVVEIASMDPPRLSRDSSGKLKVRAVITASDLVPLGPGASGYDPASSTGVVLVRRQKGVGMTVSLHRTGVRP